MIYNFSNSKNPVSVPLFVSWHAYFPPVHCAICAMSDLLLEPNAPLLELVPFEQVRKEFYHLQ